MGHSFTCLTTHVVFSTDHRKDLITPEISGRLYEYIGGILRAESCSLIAAGGMKDHSHLLIRVHPSKAVADLVRVVKSRSSGWIHDTFPKSKAFAWQTGYGAFDVSFSAIEEVKGYIAKQEEHHKKMDFKQEYVAFLDRHKIEYDPRYLWD